MTISKRPLSWPAKRTIAQARLQSNLATIKLLLLALAIYSALAASGAAVAQLSTRFDMACRGTFTNAGGTRQYPNQNFAVTSSLGQAGVGLSTSANWGLRAGYIQPAARAAAAQTFDSAAMEAREQDDLLLFLPRIGVTIPISRLCTW
jgi:hypothetical protein